MIKARNITKRFGRLVALDNLSLTVNDGDIYGFIGPNGAGKSTTFKILSTILRQDLGAVTINNIDIRRGDAVRAIIGYMPDIFGVYEDMTVSQYLDFFAAAYFITRKQRKQLIGDILDLTDLAFKRDAMVRSLSRGMQQRLGVARVLIHDPKVLILDEPASGLDPRARIELRELLKELAGMGKTIVVSSHILAELSEICTRVGIIEQGRIIFEGNREELNQRLQSQATVEVTTVPEDIDVAFMLLQEAPFVEAVARVGEKIRVRLMGDQSSESSHRVPELLVGRGCRITRFEPEELSLEGAFMALTKGKLA
jgi:ABC-2 type transport system ATP-binding protein